MRKRRALIVMAVGAIFAICIGPTSAGAATPRLGEACIKAGAASVSLVCTKLNGKLKWSTKKISQSISFAAPEQASINEKSLAFTTRSTAKLVVIAKSMTPKVCTTGAGVIQIIGSPGICRIQLSQSGNANYFAAPKVNLGIKVLGVNAIDFELPGALLLSQQSFQLKAVGASSAPLIFSTQTPQICEISATTLLLKSIGNCKVVVDQAGDELFPAAEQVKRIVEISTDRVTADLPDSITGFQIKAIYVVPADGTDNSYDVNGVLKMVLDDGVAYIKDQLGLEIPIDSTPTGYDIGFLKSSKPSQYYLSTSGSYAELLKESGVLDLPGANRKNYIFFVDTETLISPGYCGEAPRPGIAAAVAIGLAECGKSTPHFDNFASQTWVHELFHNFGVGHVADSCDLMTSGQKADGVVCDPIKLHTIDAKRNMYFGANVYGADISLLRVWKGSTNNKNLLADCLVTPTNKVGVDGRQFSYCPTGTQTIGPASYCWTNVDSVALEQLVNGAWVSVGKGGVSAQPWGPRVDWKCGAPGYQAPTIQLSVDKPDSLHYRWIINGKVAEEMTIIWVE